MCPEASRHTTRQEPVSGGPCDDGATMNRADDQSAAAARSQETGGPGQVVVVGAGPAGLTAAYALANGEPPAPSSRWTPWSVGSPAPWNARVGDSTWVGTVSSQRCQRSSNLWREILGPEDFLLRRRLSRIYYEGTYYDYPIRLGNALQGLGVLESMRCGLSFLWVRVRPSEGSRHVRRLDC